MGPFCSHLTHVWVVDFECTLLTWERGKRRKGRKGGRRREWLGKEGDEEGGKALGESVLEGETKMKDNLEKKK